MRTRGVEICVTAAAAAVTALVVAVPDLRLLVREPALHVLVETTAGLVAALVAYLLYGRFRQSRKLDDLLLVCSLGFLGVSNLLFSALPSALSPDEPLAVETWATIPAYLAAGALFAGAAFIRDVRVRPRTANRVLAGGALLLALIGAATLALSAQLPAGAEPAVAANGDPVAGPVGHPFVLAIQLLAVVIFAAVAVEFSRRAGRGDELMRWLAIASILAVFTRFNYFLYPTLYTRMISTGDLFRLLLHLVLLTGALREIDRYWRGLARAAVLEERQRIARDIHDGVAQELAFISRRVGPSTSALDAGSVAAIRAAAGRALDDSRLAIAALSRPAVEPLDVVLAEAAEAVAGRAGAALTLDLAPGVEAEPRVRDALVRIISEAVANAANHSRADTIRVELSNGRGLRLRIVDDGVGFDPDAVGAEAGVSFGLTSMRERAQALGADFVLESQPGEGTAVEVVVP